MIKVSSSNNLVTVKPKLAKEWHPFKNGKLNPEDVTFGSHRKVWWQCRKGHEWEAQIKSRSKGNGCPYCSNKKVCMDNCLATKKPELAKQWHPTKNGSLTPEGVLPSTSRAVWWLCDKGHEWRATLNNRARSRRCPYCVGKRVSRDKCLAVKNPKLAKEWHPSKNGDLTPQNVTPGSGKNVWWQCEKGHEWKGIIGNRTKGKGCPYCSNQKVCKDNCLATKNPKLAKEWHFTKNGSLTPESVTVGSNKSVWWECIKGHTWKATIHNRSKGQGCPYCGGRYALGDNCFAVAKPDLVKQWHPTKNGKLTPDNVTPKSDKKVWWICEKGHEWQTAVKNRSKGAGCHYCSNQKVYAGNSLATKQPEVAKEWHPTKNGKLTPEKVTAGSNKKAWWLCKKGHEWEAVIASRSSGAGCFYCHSQSSAMELRIYAELKCIFSDTKLRHKINKVECDVYIPSLKMGFEYDGVYWHKNKYKKDLSKNNALEKQGVRLIRVREIGLNKISEDDVIYNFKKKQDKQLLDTLLKRIKRFAVLSGHDKSRVSWYLNKSRLANNKEFINLLDMLPSPLPGSSLADKNPKLAKEWHPTKNGKLTPQDVTPGSTKKAWWLCANNHEWESIIGNRTKQQGCPYCSGRRATKERSLATEKPELAKEWHPTKNGNLTPNDVTRGCIKKVWWQCSKGHEWQAVVGSRYSGAGCAYCNRRRAHKDNCFAAVKPELIKEWHPTKNGKLTPETVTPMSDRKVWWICAKGHEWRCQIKSRTKGSGCPYCSGNKACKDNCLATVYPQHAKEWHPSKNGKLTPQNITPGSTRNVWWICKNGHAYQSVVHNKTKGVGCPYCATRGRAARKQPPQQELF